MAKLPAEAASEGGVDLVEARALAAQLGAG
jgi:hypothetical protein